MHADQARRCRSLSLLFPAFCGLVAALVLLSPGLVPQAARVLTVWLGLGVFAWAAGRLALAWQGAAPAILVLGSVGMLLACYSALSLVIPWVAPNDLEWELMSLDRRLLGYTWEGAWAGLARAWLSDVLQLVYTSFYGFPLILGVVLARRRDWWGLYNGLDRVMLGFLLSYCGYILFPTRSPYAFVEYARELPSYGLQAWLHEAIVAQSWTKRDCFPSGHTMMSCYVAWMAWQRARSVFWVLGPWALLTVVATLYLRYHYVVDVIAGFLAFLLLIPLADALLGSYRRGPEAAGGLHGRPA